MPYVLTSSAVALARRDLCRGAWLARRPVAAIGVGEPGYPADRVEGRWAVGSGAGGRRAGAGSFDGRDGHAWLLDSAGLGRGPARLAPGLPTLCINRCVGRRTG